MTGSTRFALAALLAAVLSVAPPLAAQTFANTVTAYAWANDATDASYTPSAAYAYNALGGAITATRSGTGSYAMEFADLSSVASGGSVAVTSYDAAVSCTVLGWSASGAALRIQTECRTAAGALADSPYDVMFMTAGTLSPAGIVYAWADNASSASYTPDPLYSYNPGGGAITATRSGTGDYNMSFAGAGVSLGHVQVTPYGSAAHGRCSVDGWSTPGGTLSINVSCFDGAGAPADYPYTVQFLDASAVDNKVAYAWANDASAASYTPTALYSANGAGGAITATRSAAGTYQMRFAGMGGTTAGGHVQVTRYGVGDGACRTTGWGSSGADASVSVRCVDGAGTPTDAQYDVLFVWPTRTPVAGETGPENGAFQLSAPAPNPSTDRTTLAFTLAAPAAVHLSVVDVQGREVAVLADETRAAGDHAVDLDLGGLPAGVYLVRLTADGQTATQRLTVVR